MQALRHLTVVLLDDRSDLSADRLPVLLDGAAQVRSAALQQAVDLLQRRGGDVVDGLLDRGRQQSVGAQDDLAQP
jgi:hypothetical protein